MTQADRTKTSENYDAAAHQTGVAYLLAVLRALAYALFPHVFVASMYLACLCLYRHIMIPRQEQYQHRQYGPICNS
jgi:hypothetical protein